ncbi:hypothetical protein TNCV_753031 [Trichonephila clavipes]|uniref:Uncharacterized protein n=1 Tax=Trichonephila clavipes TaxID=2585209 RepID=A0A8X6WAW2_TRICX|nr:hypothetical protein TNCV_753031 [Trichonephila clavipes]
MTTHLGSLAGLSLKLTGDSLTLDDDARKDRMDHDENLERCKLIFTGMDDDAVRIIGETFFKINWRFADPL